MTTNHTHDWAPTLGKMICRVCKMTQPISPSEALILAYANNISARLEETLAAMERLHIYRTESGEIAHLDNVIFFDDVAYMAERAMWLVCADGGRDASDDDLLSICKYLIHDCHLNGTSVFKDERLHTIMRTYPQIKTLLYRATPLRSESF